MCFLILSHLLSSFNQCYLFYRGGKLKIVGSVLMENYVIFNVTTFVKLKYFNMLR